MFYCMLRLWLTLSPVVKYLSVLPPNFFTLVLIKLQWVYMDVNFIYIFNYIFRMGSRLFNW